MERLISIATTLLAGLVFLIIEQSLLGSKVSAMNSGNIKMLAEVSCFIFTIVFMFVTYSLCLAIYKRRSKLPSTKKENRSIKK